MSGTSVEQRLRISEVIRSVHRTVCSVTHREALEADVCEAVAGSDPYVFAWIGEYDPDTDEIVPRTTAGAEDGYLDDVTITVHDPPSRYGPTATAVRTGTVQVMQDIRNDPDYEPWREAALDRGFESSAAIPIADEDDQHGVLNVYSGRAEAFEETELEMLTELGATVAAAIARVEGREELQARKRKYERLTERISDAYYAVDSEWQITYWNEQMAERTGTPPEDAVGEVLWDAFPQLLGTTFERKYRTAMDTQEADTFEQYLGAPFDYWVEVDVFPDDDGLSVFSRDVTDRKERERELERYEAFVENSSDVITIVDVDGTIRYASPASREITGYEPDDLVGTNVLERVHPDDREDVTTALARLAAEPGSTRTRTYRFEVDDGTWAWLESTGINRVEDGELDGIVTVSRDVTERKRREDALERLQERTRSLMAATTRRETAEIAVEAARQDLDAPLSGLHLLSNDGSRLEPVAVSDAVPETFGEAPTYVREDDPDPASAIVWEAFESGARRIVDDTCETDELDGETPVRSVIVYPVGDHGAFIVSASDPNAFDDTDEALLEILATSLTTALDRVERERELQEAKNTLQTTIESAPEAILMFDGELRVTLWNPSAERIYGWEREEVLGERVPFVPDEREGELRTMLEELDEGETIRSIDTVRQRRGGGRFDVSVSTAAVRAGGEFVGYLSIDRDVTPRVEYERRLEEQRDDLELLNQIVRHDIRNYLQTVTGYADHLHGTADDPERAAHLEEILASAETAVELTRTARDLAEVMLQTDADPEAVPLENALRGQVDETRATHGAASVTVDGPIPAVDVRADGRLTSVFQNVIHNAIEHNDRDVPEVSVSVTETDDSVAVHVADDGPGIGDDRKAAIFEKGEKGLDSEGTGIGLYLVSTLVESYGGTVSVEDNDPRGTVFTVELPKAD